jgi:arylsulfatase A-like enzyme
MISRLDRDVGRLLARLKEYGIDDNTLVVFSSDNGPHHEGNNNPNLFRPARPLRGMKRSLYEGGIRVPLMARWPGRIKKGGRSDHVGYFGDLFATVCELTGQKVPAGLDSISFLPTLLRGTAKQARHDFLYWEFYEQGGRQAVRFGNLKAIREPMFTGKTSLYDLAKDMSEEHDIAARHPELVAKAIQMMNDAHVDDPAWRVQEATADTRVGNSSR